MSLWNPKACMRALQGAAVGLLLLGCGVDGGADSYFRFDLGGQEFEVQGPSLSIAPIEGERHLVMITSPLGDGPDVTLIVRMALDPSSLPGLEITGRDIREDRSGAFALITEGQAGGVFTSGSSLTMRFDRVVDGFVEGTFQASRLSYSASASVMESKPVSASGRFRLSLNPSGI